MPILPQEQFVPAYGGVSDPVYAAAKKKAGPGAMETIGAAFEEGNTVGSTLKFFEYEALQRGGERLEGYDPYASGGIAGYEDHASEFAHSYSPYNTSIIKRRIDDERATRETLSRAGGWGIAASIMAGVLDPVNLIPVGGAAVKAKTLYGGLKAGVEIGFKSSLLTEAVLQATQVDRSVTDSVFNITGGTLFGGLIGGTGGAWSEWRGKPVVERALEAEYRAGVSSDDLTPEALTGQIDELVTRRRPSPEVEAPFAKAGGPHAAPGASPLDPKPFHFEEALPALREGYKAPKKAESLVEFIARTGGVADPGGELSAIDADLWHRGAPFRRKLINDTADGLNGVRERAVEAGYLPEGASTDDVLQAVRQELAGNPLYSMAAERSVHDLAGQVSELQEIMDKAGLTGSDPDDVIRKGVRDFLADQEYEDALAAWEKERDTTPPPEGIDGEWVSAGGLSADVAGVRADDLRPASSFGLAELEAKNPVADNPLLRALTSPSDETPKVMSRLAEIPIRQKGAERGVPALPSVQRSIEEWQAPLAETLQTLDDAFVRYRLGRPKQLGDLARLGVVDMAGQSGKKLDFHQFKEEVARASRRMDTHEIPEVAEAAKAGRRLILDPLKDEAVDLKLLPEGVKPETAPSYLTRVYDLEAITRNRNAAIRGVADWFEVSGRADEGLTRLDYMDDATELIDTILHASPLRTAYDVVPDVRGPLKERTLNIPDEVLDQLGMLENDYERVLRIYTRTMAADVELARAFGRPDMRDQLGFRGPDGNVKGSIETSYERLQQRTPDGPGQIKVADRMARDLSDVAAVRDRLRGTYKTPSNPNSRLVRLGRNVRTFNLITRLGGMTVTASSDVARVALAAGGFGKMLKKGVVPLITNLKDFKVGMKEMRRAAIGLDMDLDTRSMAMNDVFEDFGRYSKFERGMQFAGEKFGIVSGMSPWNAFWKQFSGVMVQGRMLEAIKGDSTPAMRTRLRELGVGAEMQTRIKALFDKHGVKKGDLWIANAEAWTEGLSGRSLERAKEARRIWRAALAKEVDRHIITPGQEKPLWMSTEWGKQAGQFKSFIFASMSRATIKGLQDRDAATAQAAIMGVGIGMMTYYVKSKLAGKEPSTNPAKWVVEGIDYSGLTGWLMEANNMSEKFSGGRVGINRLIGEEQATRYASRGKLAAIGGPTAGLIEDAGQIVGNVAMAAIPGEDGKRRPLTRADVGRARRLIPFQNVFYLNSVFDAGEDAVGDAAGMPEEPKK